MLKLHDDAKKLHTFHPIPASASCTLSKTAFGFNSPKGVDKIHHYFLIAEGYMYIFVQMLQLHDGAVHVLFP